MAGHERFYFTLQCTEASVEEIKITHGYESKHPTTVLSSNPWVAAGTTVPPKPTCGSHMVKPFHSKQVVPTPSRAQNAASWTVLAMWA
jgi:hypothetical protein